ncbi:MAG: hypothetical protein IT436_15625 [Phycisphaerales bacterium]|nr:hypothetical protein [Phycisphaerales bacterium]
MDPEQVDPDELGRRRVSPAVTESPEAAERAEHVEPEEAAHVFIMPGPREEVAEEVAAEGVEGRPADVRAGPRMLWSELAIMGALVAAAAVAFGVWLGWLAGLAAMAFGLLALVFNPVVGATLNRAHDRDVVAHRRTRRT